jgi:hypothetical protein
LPWEYCCEKQKGSVTLIGYEPLKLPKRVAALSAALADFEQAAVALAAIGNAW